MFSAIMQAWTKIWNLQCKILSYHHDYKQGDNCHTFYFFKNVWIFLSIHNKQWSYIRCSILINICICEIHTFSTTSIRYTKIINRIHKPHYLPKNNNTVAPQTRDVRCKKEERPVVNKGCLGAIIGSVHAFLSSALRCQSTAVVL